MLNPSSTNNFIPNRETPGSATLSLLVTEVSFCVNGFGITLTVDLIIELLTLEPSSSKHNNEHKYYDTNYTLSSSLVEWLRFIGGLNLIVH